MTAHRAQAYIVPIHAARLSRAPLRLALSVGAALLATGTASAQVSVIDSSGLVADHASLAIGSNGRGLIAYFDQSDLKVAHCSDLACTSATLSTVATNQGAEPSIAIGGDGLGLVVYQGQNSVGVAHCLDAPCTSVETSLLAGGSPGNVVQGSDGLGLIVWTDATSDIQVTHCANAACSSAVTTEVGYGVGPAIGVGPDGLGLIVFDDGSGPIVNPVVVHCENVACTAFTSVQPPVGDYVFGRQDLTFGGDGLAVFGYLDHLGYDELAHCQDAGCTSFQSSALSATEVQYDETLATGPDGFVLAAANDVNATAFLHVWHCTGPLCASAEMSPILDAKARRPSIAVGSDGLPLIAYAVLSGDLRVAHCLTSGCADEVAVSIGDVSVTEGDAGTSAAVFTLTLNHPSSLPVTVSYATADGTAHAPADYAAVSGTASFPPGTTAASLAIDVVGDTVYEGDETFSVNLSAPVNAFLASTRATGTILNDDTGAYGPVVPIDTQGDVGDFPGLVLGSDGLGLVSYYDRTNGDLKAAHCADVVCSSASVSTLDSVGDAGSETAVILGGDQRALIAYSDRTNQSIKVAHCDDLACSSAQTQVLAPGRAGGVAKGGDGLPLVVGTSGTALRVIHCDDVSCANHTATDYAGGAYEPNVVVGPDGLGLVLFLTGTSIKALHCQNAACSSATISTPIVQPFLEYLTRSRGLAVGADGRAFFVFSLVYVYSPPGIQGSGTETIAHCGDADCSFVAGGTTPDVPVPGAAAWLGPDGLGLLAGFAGAGLSVAHCADMTCSQTSSANPLSVAASATAAVNAQDGYPLLAFYDLTNGDLDVEHCTQPACGAPPPFFLSIPDVAQPEGNAGLSSFVFNVTLDPPSSLPVSVSYHTVDGSATSPEDYVATSGTVSFAPGVTSQAIPVSVVGDTYAELEDAFSVVLDQAVNASISKRTGTGTIQNDDALPVVLRTNAEVTEGDSGTTSASVEISLSYPPRIEAIVSWGLGGGTATPGVDFLPNSNQIIFQPGEVYSVVSASILGDTLVEPDEYFFVDLSAVNATVDPSNGRITIVDDDAPSLSSDELAHGSVQHGNLQAQPGPVADVDYYRLGQSPYSSWEVVVDGLSSDLAPVVVERLAADNATVLGTATAVAGGSSVSMRWSNDTEFPILNQHLSVRSGGCGPSCDPSAGYRIRAYETTGRIARFNDSGTQVTVMILGNTGAAPVQGTVYFWAADGTLLASQPVSLDPHAQFVLNTATIPALAGASGSISLTSDAPYGSLQGKAVAVEPATGFSFDTAAEYRPR